MGWDACFRSCFYPDGAFFGSRKEQEGKKCHKVHLGSVALAMKRKKCPSKGLAVVKEVTQRVSMIRPTLFVHQGTPDEGRRDMGEMMEMLG